MSGAGSDGFLALAAKKAELLDRIHDAMSRISEGLAEDDTDSLADPQEAIDRLIAEVDACDQELFAVIQRMPDEEGAAVTAMLRRGEEAPALPVEHKAICLDIYRKLKAIEAQNEKNRKTTLSFMDQIQGHLKQNRLNKSALKSYMSGDSTRGSRLDIKE